MDVFQIGLVGVAYKEEIAQHADLVSLLSFAQKLCYGNSHHLAQKVKAGSFDGGLYVNAGAEVKGLVAADILFALGCQIFFHLAQGGLVFGQAGAFYQELYFIQSVCDLVAAGDFADAFIAFGICQDDNVSGEIGAVGTAQVQFHTVMSRYRIDFHFFDSSH